MYVSLSLTHTQIRNVYNCYLPNWRSDDSPYWENIGQSLDYMDQDQRPRSICSQGRGQHFLSTNQLCYFIICFPLCLSIFSRLHKVSVCQIHTLTDLGKINTFYLHYNVFHVLKIFQSRHCNNCYSFTVIKNRISQV